MRDIARALETWMREGYEQIGEVRIRALETGFELRHYADAGHPVEGLRRVRPEDVRDLVRLDAHGKFRPLKTVPNLARGWILVVPDVGALRRMLDQFYPAMVGILVSQQQGTLEPVSLRETLERQTGMYAVTRRISDDDADRLAGSFCESGAGCLKTILWQIRAGRKLACLPPGKFDLSENQTGDDARALPMLCHEACNFFVSEAREWVRQQRATE
ncbi:MAG TPA: DR2241 family protein [Chthoniobacteraceae bacterium]|nr:DR2241 family protein [Chthoniobacteraceae bacterium]